METEEERKEVGHMLSRVEGKFQNIDAQLDTVEKMLDGSRAEAPEEAPHDDLPEKLTIAADLEAYQQAVDNLHEARKAIYQYEAQGKESSDIQVFNDVHRMLAMLGDMRGQSEELKRQCDYMKQTQASLQEISHNEQLMQMLETLQNRMAALGGYDEKIKAAAQTAMDQVAGLSEALDHRLTDIKRMEEAIITASQELQQVAGNMDTIVREASNASAETIQTSLSQLNQEFKEKIANMEQVVEQIVHAAQESAKHTDEMMNVRTEDMAFLNGHQALLDKMKAIEVILADEKIKEIHDANWNSLVNNWDYLEKVPELCNDIQKLADNYNYVLDALQKIEEQVK